MKKIEDHRLRELLIQDLKHYPRCRIGEIRERIGLGIRTGKIRNQLNLLIAEGLVRVEGAGNFEAILFFRKPCEITWRKN